MSAPQKILVIRLSSLGDILHTLPAFFDLRHSFPNARIDWVAARSCAFLLAAVRGIDTVRIFDKSAIFPFSRNRSHPVWSLIRGLRREHYDCVIDFQGLLKTAFLGFASGTPTRIGFPKDLVREKPAHRFYNRTPAVPGEPMHILSLNRKLAALAAARPFSVPFDPVLQAGEREHVESLLAENGLADFAVVNPGGGWKSKTWKPQYYGRLAHRIQKELHLRVAVTTGPGEDALYEEMTRHCGAPLPVHIRVSFLQLIPLLEKARLLIGTDTGPFHLACALQTPVVGLFGPTSAVRNGPWQAGNEIVTNGVACGGCYKRECPTDNACMEIPVEVVFEAVARRLQNLDRKPI